MALFLGQNVPNMLILLILKQLNQKIWLEILTTDDYNTESAVKRLIFFEISQLLN